MLKIHSTWALRLGAAGASIAISGALLFGHSAWAPTDVVVEGSLPGFTSSVAAAHYRVSREPTLVVFWPTGGANVNSDGSPAAGAPCSTTSLPAGAITTKVIHATSTWRTCY